MRMLGSETSFIGEIVFSLLYHMLYHMSKVCKEPVMLGSHCQVILVHLLIVLGCNFEKVYSMGLKSHWNCTKVVQGPFPKVLCTELH